MEKDLTSIEEDAFDVFYKDAVKTIRLVFLYINDAMELIYSKKFNIPLENEIMTKSQLLYLLKQHATHNKTKFYPLHLLKYNINLDSREIPTFVDDPIEYNFMSIVPYVNGLRWNKTIKYLHSLNSLYIIMKQRKKSTHNSTKKIFLHSKRRKTRRKYI